MQINRVFRFLRQALPAIIPRLHANINRVTFHNPQLMSSFTDGIFRQTPPINSAIPQTDSSHQLQVMLKSASAIF